MNKSVSLDRSADLQPRLKGKMEISEVVLIIQGPQQPKHIEPYLEFFIADHKKYGPTGTGGAGWQITDAHRSQDVPCGRCFPTISNLHVPGPGLQVTEAPSEGGDGEAAAAGRTFMHTVFMTAMHADTPARQKLVKWLAVAAYIACG